MLDLKQKKPACAQRSITTELLVPNAIKRRVLPSILAEITW